MSKSWLIFYWCAFDRLKEQLTQELILGKLDIFGNLQTLSRIPAIKVSLETVNGDNFLAGSLFNATDIKLSPDKKHLILGKVCHVKNPIMRTL